MKMYLDLVDTDEVLFSERRVMAGAEIKQCSYDWEEVVDVYNTETNRVEKLKIADVSIYGNQIIIDGKKHCILRALSK